MRSFGVREFDGAPAAVRRQLSSARVIRAFGSWREALDVAAGKRARFTAVKAAVHRARTGSKRRVDDHLVSTRAWLETKPASRRGADCDAWRREENLGVEKGELPRPSQAAPASGWPRVGKWALATGSSVLKGLPPCLVSTARHLTESASSPGFPTSVATFDNRQVWLREDIEAYAVGKSFPEREPGYLRPLYLTVRDVQTRIGGRRIRTPAGLPQAGIVGGVRIWRQSDVDAYLRRREDKK